MSGPVVVGVDGTAAALGAVRWAVAYADRHGGGLRLVHAVEPHDLAHRLDAATVAGMPVTVVKDDLSAAELLVRESARASLVVLGTRGAGGYFGRMIGATATTFAARGQCPMVVTDSAGEPAEGPVVVGIDGTPTSDAAVDFAFREAALHRTGLLAVHGATAPHPEADEMIAERLRCWCEQYREVDVTREIVPNTAGKALLDRAAGARLVVVGSRRRVGYRGLVLRSTGQYLLDHASCPVAVVRRDHIT
jgi:nucleotide-binding universal stress UspA family protein